MENFKLIQINETFAPLNPFTEEFIETEAGDYGGDTIECPECKGCGKIDDEYCNKCQGEGWVWITLN